MATLVLTLPDEATQKLRAIPEPLRLKIEAAAKTKGLEGFSFFVMLALMLVAGPENITQEPVELDILDELRLYFQAFNTQAFNTGALRQSGKRLDELNGLSFLVEDKQLLQESGQVQETGQATARIAGTRMKVTHIAEEHTRLGMTPEQIVEAHPHLTLPQVNAALAYYYSNRDAVEAAISASLAYTDRARQQAGASPLSARLRGQKAPLGIDASPDSYPAPTRNPASDRLSERTKDRR